MAAIHQEISIDVPAEQLWDAMRDVGALPTRLVAGFVSDCRLDGNARIVTFANGMVAREVIVDLDDTRRRLAWSATGGRLTHHNASAQVFAEGPGRCRVVWIADLLPDAMAPAIAGMIAQGLTAMKTTLEAAPRPDPARPLGAR
ncbi:SRPBCC family protein [Aquabacterium sp.]|uniref:SRPBCC family protein n=1 Tax=Aquabacterium sp. TaxID=1872578 RepID=UPI002CDD27DF|nr:SRPBCC family protein [Aquabacterium sp.]HSW04224.1 SRPBCC family protein [Aquabacterium sp.]